MFLQMIAACLLLCCSCTALDFSPLTLQRLEAAPVSPAPQANKAVFFGDVGNIMRFVEPISLTREEISDNTRDFPLQYNDGNNTLTGIEWVLTTATFSYDSNASTVTCTGATFQPYHDNGTYYGSSHFSYAPLKFICSTYPSNSGIPVAYVWSSLGFDLDCSNATVDSSASVDRLTPQGYYRYRQFTTTGGGPYKMGLLGYSYQGGGYSAVQLLDNLCSAYASATSSIAREYDYNTAYGEGYDAGLRVGDANGYNRGYREGADASNNSLMLIPTLFEGLAYIPISIFGGLGDLAIWNVPIISIIFTFLILALVLWLVRKFI